MTGLRFGLVLLGALAGFVLLSPAHLEWNPLTNPLFNWFESVVVPPCRDVRILGEVSVQPACAYPRWPFLAMATVGLLGGALASALLTRRIVEQTRPSPS